MFEKYTGGNLMNKMKLCVMLGSFVMLGGCMATVSPSGRVSMAYVPTSTVVVEKHHRGGERRYYHAPIVQHIYTKPGPRYAHHKKKQHFGKKYRPVIVQHQVRPGKGKPKYGVGQAKPAPKGKAGKQQTHFGKGGNKGQEKRAFQAGLSRTEQKFGGKQQGSFQAKRANAGQKSFGQQGKQTFLGGQGAQQGKQAFGRGQAGQQTGRSQTAKRAERGQRNGR